MDYWPDSPLNKVLVTIFFRRKYEKKKWRHCPMLLCFVISFFFFVTKLATVAYLLFQAHYYDRRGVVLAKKFCFDEAIECHMLAAQLLSESIVATENDKAKQSIALQREYHLKQKDILR